MSASNRPIILEDEHKISNETQKLKQLYIDNLPWDLESERIQRGKIVKRLTEIALAADEKAANEAR